MRQDINCAHGISTFFIYTSILSSLLYKQNSNCDLQLEFTTYCLLSRLAFTKKYHRNTSGCTVLLYYTLSQFTHSGYSCALVDASDCFDPMDAEVTGVELNQVLWIRCEQSEVTEQYRTEQKSAKVATSLFKATAESYEEHIRKINVSSKERKAAADDSIKTSRRSANRSRTATEQELATARGGKHISEDYGMNAERYMTATELHYAGYDECEIECGYPGSNTRRRKLLKPLEQAFKAADILVQNGGFGLIAVDLSNIDWRHLRKVPLTTWFRFARVAKKTETALIVLTSCPVAHSYADVTLQMHLDRACWSSGTKEFAEISELARTNKVVPEENSIKQMPNRVTAEFFTYNEQLPLSANQPRHGRWNAAGAPFKKEESSQGQRDAVRESKKRASSSHTHLFEGAECELEFRWQKKPVQQVKPGFTAISTWK